MFDLGRGPFCPQFIPSAQWDLWEIAATPVGGGNKTNKGRLNGIPENSDAAADTEKWFFIHATPLQEVLF